MSTGVKVCEVDPELKKKLKKFRFRKETTNGAIIMKINKDDLTVYEEEDYDDISFEDLGAELPSSQPRFLVYSYKYEHDDGRVSYPLCFIFYSPDGCRPEHYMMYAGSKNNLVKESEITKIFETRNVDDFNEEWLKSKLGFFR